MMNKRAFMMAAGAGSAAAAMGLMSPVARRNRDRCQKATHLRPHSRRLAWRLVLEICRGKPAQERPQGLHAFPDRPC
jgi:hypothetical protein